MIAATPEGQAINTVIQNYAVELKGTVPKNFTVPRQWTTELMRRLAAADVKLDVKFDTVEKRILTRDLVQRVARMSFGDAAAKLRALNEDHQLERAIDLLERSATQTQLLASAPPSSPK